MLLKIGYQLQHKARVLVVGTTPDYIDFMRKACPERALFITAPEVRHNAREQPPRDHEEILCNLEDNEEVLSRLLSHLDHWGEFIDGVACFDCESLALASFLAQRFSVPYPSPEAVNNCRNKYISKLLWQKNHIRCPKVKTITSMEESLSAFKEFGRDIVLKPLSSSGSELVFHCKSEEECVKAFNTIQNGIRRRKNNMLYKDISFGSPDIIAEEFIDAAEFSCDFLLEGNTARIIRLSRKIHSEKGPFGTIKGYVLADSPSNGPAPSELLLYLTESASALGLTRSICMADFMIKGKDIILLEITPRPGGDCLPSLLLNAYGLDILALTLDFAQMRPVQIVKPNTEQQFAGLRIHAQHGGILRRIDTECISQDPRIREIYLRRRAGDTIKMPPEEYESFLLGHVIFNLSGKTDIENECNLLMDKVLVEIEAT
jgi:predicted ATP-grasp superfamily ATP-dependent carboligase